MASNARTRLLALAAVVSLLIGIAGVSAVRASAPDPLPPIPPDELLASSIEAMAAPFSISGDVTSRIDTGLPDLPAALGGAGTGLGSLATALTGTQRFKVWRSPDGVRVARVTDLSEQVVVANHREGWLWDSDGMTAVRLDATALRSRLAGRWPMAAVAAPARAELTGWIGDALAALAPFATVSVDRDVEVAGRAAYDLVLTPAPGPTLVGRMSVAIDAESRLPLRFSVTPKGTDDPAIEVGFDAVSLDPIDPAMFEFVPPPGARVSDADLPTPAVGSHGTGSLPTGGLAERPRIFGRGFSARIAIPLSGPLPDGASALLPYAGPLASAIVVDDEWLLAGAVPVTTLERDADRLA